MSTNFMILGAMDQKLWMFEVFRRSMGRAGMCWSQPARVDHVHKKWKARGKKNSKKENRSQQPSVDRSYIDSPWVDWLGPGGD
jgi:hypothetical protein